MNGWIKTALSHRYYTRIKSNTDAWISENIKDTKQTNQHSHVHQHNGEKAASVDTHWNPPPLQSNTREELGERWKREAGFSCALCVWLTELYKEIVQQKCNFRKDFSSSYIQYNNSSYDPHWFSCIKCCKFIHIWLFFKLVVRMNCCWMKQFSWKNKNMQVQNEDEKRIEFFILNAIKVWMRGNAYLLGL